MDEIAFLEELVAIPSPSGAEETAVEWLLTRMAELGFHAYRDGAGNAVGVLGPPGGKPTILLLGHIDTVEGWIPVRREGNRLHGRGTVDAKGPLATFVLAAVRAAPRLGKARVVVVGAVEEERRSKGAHHLVETVPPPDYALVGEPSGWDGITLGYKGSLTVEYRRVQPVGHTAGAGEPPAQTAVAFWNRLVEYTREVNQRRAAARDVADPPRFEALDPSLRAIRTFGDGLQEGVEMHIGLRLPPGIDVEALVQRMRTWADGAELTFPYAEPPFRAEKNTPLVRALLRAIRAEGGRPRFKLKTGTSDMNVVGPAWGCPIAAYGPGNSALDHTPEEYIDLAEFQRGIRVLTTTLEILGGKD
ncbi:MAG TPA: [LysW]-lysine hydrolase [Thermoflexia bacterium]|jgi:LysW-gamma-L-lysine carboxypeptidase|nr:[LysW]-lysine hydrolase [Thermoflexia bacterium]